jgi:hypothetical protein
MEGVTWQEKPALQILGPSGSDKFQVERLIGAVDFIADNRVA